MNLDKTLQTLKEWLERIGFECTWNNDFGDKEVLNIWCHNRTVGYVFDDGYFLYTTSYHSLSDKHKGQIDYLIAKWRGDLKHEAILEFKPDNC